VVDKVTIEQLFGEVHRGFLAIRREIYKKIYFNCCIKIIVYFMYNKVYCEFTICEISQL